MFWAASQTPSSKSRGAKATWGLERQKYGQQRSKDLATSSEESEGLAPTAPKRWEPDPSEGSHILSISLQALLPQCSSTGHAVPWFAPLFTAARDVFNKMEPILIHKTSLMWQLNFLSTLCCFCSPGSLRDLHIQSKTTFPAAFPQTCVSSEFSGTMQGSSKCSCPGLKTGGVWYPLPTSQPTKYLTTHLILSWSCLLHISLQLSFSHAH